MIHYKDMGETGVKTTQTEVIQKHIEGDIQGEEAQARITRKIYNEKSMRPPK